MSLVGPEVGRWNLFGLDLSQIVAWLRLGFSQLLWGDESGLKARFYPQIQWMGESAGGENPEVSSDLTEFFAVSLPEEQALVKVVSLPKAAELFLEDALMLEVANCSPFLAEQTVYGWRINRRLTDSLEIVLAISARSTVWAQASLAVVHDEAREKSLEVWVDTREYGAIVLRGFGEGARQAMYLKRLVRLAVKAGLLLMLLLALATVPSIYMSERVRQVNSELDRMSRTAQSALEVRDELESRRVLLGAAQSFFSRRADYRGWLHILAKVTPDSVYMRNVELDGDELTVSGAGVNAADYLTILADSGYFSELEAPSAFTRERTTNRERFTIEMRLGDFPDND